MVSSKRYMNKKPRTYDELLEEEKKLEELFKVQRELLRHEVSDIRNEFEPVFNLIHFINKISRKNLGNPVIQAGINILIDLLMEKLNGPDAGFIKKVIIPEALKKYSSILFTGRSN